MKCLMTMPHNDSDSRCLWPALSWDITSYRAHDRNSSVPSGEILYMVCNFDPSIHQKLGKSGNPRPLCQITVSREVSQTPKLEIYARHLSLDCLWEVIQSEGSWSREWTPSYEVKLEGPCTCSKFYWKISSSGFVACEPETCGWNVGTGQDAKAKGRPKRFGCSCYIIFWDVHKVVLGGSTCETSNLFHALLRPNYCIVLLTCQPLLHWLVLSLGPHD